MIPFGTNVVAQDLLDQLKIFAFGLYSFVEVISGIDIWHMVRRLGKGEIDDRDPFERRVLRVQAGKQSTPPQMMQHLPTPAE